ncbi:hypothetical protein Hanom_Chr05g00440431 [Helianthus anomalus]
MPAFRNLPRTSSTVSGEGRKPLWSSAVATPSFGQDIRILHIWFDRSSTSLFASLEKYTLKQIIFLKLDFVGLMSIRSILSRAT